MYQKQLRAAYDAIHHKSMACDTEPFNVIELIHQYRMYWKPEVVNTMLLAESHVFTDANSYFCDHNFTSLPDYPKDYARFIYCLSYGDNDSIVGVGPLPIRNNGTPQFWKIFNQTVVKEFHVTNNPDKVDKRNQKISLLREMQKKGIWLMDCSVTGVSVPNGQAPSNKEYTHILKSSFENYCLPIIESERPKQIIVIGQRVHNLLKNNYKLNIAVDWIHQPQARVTNDQRRTLSKIGYQAV